MAERPARWGIRFPLGSSELDMWLWRYAHDKRGPEEGGVDEETKWEAFKKCVDILWNNPSSTRRIIWNPWTERMLRAMVKYRYVALAGCGSSGKSDSAAVFALVEWLAAPTETLCLITSTTIEGAKKRVWKSVTELWNSLEAQWKREGRSLPGKILNSGNNAQIKGIDINGVFSSALGLSIVAADTSADQSASKKLKGLKAPAEGRGRLRLIADELPDLGRSVYVAAIGNLNANPDFKCVGLGNPRFKMDPFGELSEPSREGSWKAVTAMDDWWETDVGVCIRFDATKSPRLTEKDGDSKYPWMPDQQYIDQIKKKFGEDSAEFWSQVRGMWPPDGLDNSIWSEGELLSSEQDRPIKWDAPNRVTRISGLDIPYTSGGDRAPFIWAECGKVNGVKKMRILGYHVLSEGITEDSFTDQHSDKGEVMSANLHLIQQYKSLNMELGITPRHTGFDATAGGKIFSDWVTAHWKPGCRAINFGGKPSDRSSSYDDKPDEQDYGNRVAQLWCQPKPLVREGQILCVPREVSMELCQRKFSHKSTSGKLWIETKDEMKKRTGESPDCFVSGTKVSTPSGDVLIENLREGDLVITPFGHSRIIKIHEVFTEELTSVSFSDGSSLEGKGQHRVMTPGGWTRLDSLSLTNEVESIRNRSTWQFLNTFTTRARSLDFKHLVDTIKATPTKAFTESAYFTGPFGQITMARFLMAIAFIMSMVIGLTVKSKISKLCVTKITRGFTWVKGLLSLEPWKRTLGILIKLKKRPRLGTLVPQGLSGTERMVSDALLKRKNMTSCACTVAGPSKVSGQVPSSVKTPVASDSAPTHTNQTNRVCASFVDLVSSGINTGPRKPVVVDVQQHLLLESRKVYNLTLEEENAYYANGVLVENCADAFVILVEVALMNGLLEFEEVKNIEKTELRKWKKLASGHGNPFSGKAISSNPHPKRLTFRR